MKKNILIIGLASIFGIASGLISCSPDYETEFKVETLVVPDKSQAPITFPLLGGEHEIEVQTNVPLDRWSAQSNAEWCKVVQHEGKVVVSASANNIYKQRRAEITVAYGHQSYSITVSQFGKEPAILIGDKLQQEGYVEIIDAEKETLTAENEAKAKTVAEQEKSLNAAWFVFGTKSELKAQKILQSGDVLKSADFNKDYFTQIDIRTTKEIKLYSKRAELLTTHPAGSYELVKDDKGQLTLKITNPTEFWSVSKYLVIQVK